ncbi:putative ribonuclease H-like domain-containing protein [Tanacetum coccineum]
MNYSMITLKLIKLRFISPVKTNESQTVKPRVDKIDQTFQKQGIGFKKIKACFVCKSTNHLIKDCNFHDKKSQEPKLKNMVNTGPRVNKPVWDNAKRQNEKRAVHKVIIARPVSTVRPFAPKIAQTSGAIRPIYPRIDNVRPRGSYSPIKRSYYTKLAFRPKDLKQDVKTFGVQNMTTAGTRAVVNTRKGKMDIDLKKSRWVWRPKGNYLDHVSKDIGSFMLKKVECDNGTEFKNYAMNEFCAKKGIKREFSVARTPQQNGVAERITGPKVLVTKPQNKTPYELLIGKSPSISFMRPFGCPLTILNTLDSLGKFDGKSDEGYLLGYSTSDQPNVVGTGPNWMFDLDFLTNSMNYIPVSVENQVNVDAGTQDSYVAGSSGKDKGPTQEYILLPLQPHRTRILVEYVALAAHEKPSESSPKDNDVQDSEDITDKEGQHQMPEYEQVLHDNLENMIAQEKVAQATSTNILSTVSTATTPYVSAASTPIGTNAGESSFVYLGGKIPINASTLPNVDLPIDPNMLNLEDASDTLPNDRIFNGAYDDDEDVGAVADFTNMDNTIAVSPIPTLRIYKDHPKGQILGDPTSTVQIRGKIQKASSAQ